MSGHASLTSDGNDAVASVGKQSTRTLALAGILGPIVFTATFIAQAFFKDGYSHVSDPVSALAAGENGWIQDVNFFVFGALMMAFAGAIYRSYGSSRLGTIGAASMFLSAVGLVVAGIFPARDATGAFDVSVGHVTGSVLVFLGAGGGFVLLSMQMARDTRWRDLAKYTLLSGISVIGLFLAAGRLAIPDGAPLHEWTGLLQRLVIAVWFACTIVISTRLRGLDTSRNRSFRG